MTLSAKPLAWPSAEMAEQRAVAILRLLLAASGLAVVFVDPTQPARHVPTIYAVLGLYTLYAVAVYARSLRARGPGGSRAHWIDVAWYLVLMALSGGSSSLFFVLFFFPILVASFHSGFRSGIATTLASAAGIVGVGLAVGSSEPGFELNRFLLRPISLLAIGFVISSRGGFETLLKRRLALLKEIGRLSNPRLGTDRTIAASLERLRAYYDADDCLLLLAEGDLDAARLRRATRSDPERARSEDPLPAALAGRLLALPAGHAFVHAAGRRRAPWRPASFQYDVVGGVPVAVDPDAERELVAWFAPSSFLTVPVLGRGGVIGRLYLACGEIPLGPGDVEFLLQVVDCLLPLLENVHLIDRLAANAAEEERRKIARDVHDGIIQPYIGLRIGLAALQQQAAAAREAEGPRREAALASLDGGVGRLLASTDGGLADLRSFVARLRTGGEGGGGFASIVEGYARRFAELTGIAVQVEIDAAPELDANDRLAAEVFLMVTEGLSNVRRHGGGKRALVRITQARDALEVAVENDGAPERPVEPFTPRSLADRARSLAGWVSVSGLPDGGTRVAVTIPL